MTAATAPAVDDGESLFATVARYVRHPDSLRLGNAVRPLIAGGETFPAMLAAIAKAKVSVCLETYIVTADATGERFADAMIARAKDGVKVRFLFDAVGGFGLGAQFLGRLRDAGVELAEFNPLSPWRRKLSWSHRDHKKILVVDDLVAFTGGLNLANEYAAVEDGGGGWHDVHCELQGPVVRDLARLFRATWLKAGGADYPVPPSADEADQIRAGMVAARVLDNHKKRKRGAFGIRRSYLRAINAARATVHLENAYFLPDRGMRRAMRRAIARGVDVAIIVPGHSDVRLIEYAGLYMYRHLAADGIRMLRWTGPMMHAKTAVIDGTWSTIGSFNLDARSFRHNLELMVEVIDPDVGARMEAAWQIDQLHTEAIDGDTWTRLGWWQKALAWVAYRFRAML